MASSRKQADESGVLGWRARRWSWSPSTIWLAADGVARRDELRLRQRPHRPRALVVIAAARGDGDDQSQDDECTHEQSHAPQASVGSGSRWTGGEGVELSRRGFLVGAAATPLAAVLPRDAWAGPGQPLRHLSPHEGAVVGRPPPG